MASKELALDVIRTRFDEFMLACESQWRTGGKRYALPTDKGFSEEKEFTDLVCELVGNQWIGGNIFKYSGEIENYKKFEGKVPEVNFLKMSVYSYIWWLKEFKHPMTGIKLKEMHWKEFVDQCWNYYASFRPKEKIGSEDFKCHVQTLTMSRRPTEMTFFFIVSDSFTWWLREEGNYSSKDEGEDFRRDGKAV